VTAFLLLLACLYVVPARAQDKGFPGANFQDLRLAGQGRVVQIIDPQTLRLKDGSLIRLSGLDFPDYSPDEPGDISITALRVLRDMLEGQDVNLYHTKKSDTGRVNRMGHHIAHLERKEDKAWVQGSLIALGLARVRSSKSNPEMALQMYTLEKQARKESLGLWEIDVFKILTPEESENHIGSFQVVEGRIESVAIRRNRIYMNFGKNWRDDFTVSIAPSDRRLFSKQGLDPLQWNGKHVRVRGWIESYNGPYMEINHPQSIEIQTSSAWEENDTSQALQEERQGPMVRSIDTNH